ncbi:MAG TPA: Rpn family recombination-promoting nuclease/putative transposase, partial [Flavobacterium sp.]|nr:Rpn family recombination-promoting nuclease/putative transposase [Flavobacterium sp.]
SSGDYSLVEIQVKKQDFWDDRALAYVCSVYGNQLSVGGKWANLKKVIGINILGGGPSNVKYWGKNDRPFRHYVVQDKYNSEHVIKGVELIQYSLGDIKWNDEKIRDNKNLKDWLEYFKDAHTKEKIPEDVSAPLKKAYEKIMFDKIPDEIKKDYESEAASFENLTDYTKSVKEETKREMALKMIADGVSVENVSKYTELSVDEVKALQIQ